MAAHAFTWGCGDFGRDLRSAAADDLTRQEAQGLLPSYDDLSKALYARIGTEHASSHPACVKKTQKAWNKLGQLLRGKGAKGGRVMAALDRVQSASEGSRGAGIRFRCPGRIARAQAPSTLPQYR